MKKTWISGAMCLGMMAILSVLGLFEFPYRQIVFSAVSVLLFTACGILLLQMSAGMGAKAFFRLRATRFRDYGIVLLCLIVVVCGSFLLNYTVGALFDLAGVQIENTNVSSISDNYLLGVVTVALIPAIFEELFFRGAVLSGFHDKGTLYGILVSSALFVLMHGLDPFFLTTFFAGCVFAVTVLLTNSIFAAMFVHFANNIISYFLSVYSDRLAQVDLDLFMFYGVIVVFLISLYGILSSAIKKYKRVLKRERNILNEGEILWQDKAMQLQDGAEKTTAEKN